MQIWNRIMPRKRHIVECISGLPRNKADPMHPRHRPVHDFLMNNMSGSHAYCSFDNRLEASSLHVERTGQLDLS